MKNLIKHLGVIALAALIAFSMTACSGKSGPTNFGEKLEFSGEQVYTMERVKEGDNITVNYKPYTSFDVTFDNSKITGGKFSVTRGAPSILDVASIIEILRYINIYDNFTNVLTSDTTVKAAVIFNFGTQTGEKTLSRENTVYKNIQVTGTGEDETWSGSLTEERMIFVYVDKPVKITGTGRTETLTQKNGGTYIEKYNDLNLSLAKGWNTFYTKMDISFLTTGINITNTISVSNPSSLKWVLVEYD